MAPNMKGWTQIKLPRETLNDSEISYQSQGHSGSLFKDTCSTCMKFNSDFNFLSQVNIRNTFGISKETVMVSMVLFMAKLFPFYFTVFSNETKSHKRKTQAL